MRLLAENVLAGVDGGLQERGMEVRRAGDQHDVDVAVDHLLVGVEADEAMGVVDRPAAPGYFFLSSSQAALELLGEDVGHGHQPDVLAGVHGIGGRAAATPAAADQPDLDHVAAGGMGAAGQRQGRRTRPRPGRPDLRETHAATNANSVCDSWFGVMTISVCWVSSQVGCMSDQAWRWLLDTFTREPWFSLSDADRATAASRCIGFLDQRHVSHGIVRRH